MSTKHLSNRVDALAAMDLDALRKEFSRVLGRPTNSKDKESMVQQIGERLLHGKRVPTVETAAATTPKAKRQTRTAPTPGDAPKPSPFTQDPRLPAPGSTITVTHKKKEYSTKYLGADGFDYEGERYRSLSAIASRILGGASVNGFLWWGLIPKAAKPAAARTEGTTPAEAPAKEPAAPRAKRAAKAKKPARKGAKS